DTRRPARGGPDRRRQRGAGVLARDPPAAAPRAAVGAGHPGTHLVEEFRSVVRAGPAQSEDRHPVALHVVHHVRRRLPQPRRGHRPPAADGCHVGDRALHLVLGADGAEPMSIRSVPVRVAAPVPPRATLRRPPRRWPTALRYLALYGLAAFFLMP